MDLYYLKDGSDYHYYLHNDNDSLKELKNSEVKISNESNDYFIKKREYVGILKNENMDCPEIFLRINEWIPKTLINPFILESFISDLED